MPIQDTLGPLLGAFALRAVSLAAPEFGSVDLGFFRRAHALGPFSNTIEINQIAHDLFRLPSRDRDERLCLPSSMRSARLPMMAYFSRSRGAARG